jgi:hypothetical protein
MLPVSLLLLISTIAWLAASSTLTKLAFHEPSKTRLSAADLVDRRDGNRLTVRVDFAPLLPIGPWLLYIRARKTA